MFLSQRFGRYTGVMRSDVGLCERASETLARSGWVDSTNGVGPADPSSWQPGDRGREGGW